MKYSFQYFNPDVSLSISKEFTAIKEISVNQINAKKIGVISLRAIREYEKVKEKHQSEKRMLKVWVREQRNKTRSKSDSKTRANTNRRISNVNDNILNSLDLIYNEAVNNLNPAKSKLNQCLQFYTKKDILEYEKTYLNEQNKIQRYEELQKERKNNLSYFGICLLFLAIAIWWTIAILGVISLVFLIIVYFRIKELDKIIKEEENQIQQAKENMKVLENEREQERKEQETFTLELSGEENKEQDSDDLSEDSIVKELATQLEKEYYFLENACLSYKIDANTWLDLAEKIQNESHNIENDQSNGKDFGEQSDDSREPYTVDSLKENFDSFQAAKDYFGIKARSWKALADYLNEE